MSRCIVIQAPPEEMRGMPIGRTDGPRQCLWFKPVVVHNFDTKFLNIVTVVVDNLAVLKPCRRFAY